MPLPVTLDFRTCEVIHLLILFAATICVERSTSKEANKLSASQKIPRTLWIPEVHYRIDKIQPPVHILSQINPFDASSTYLLKTCLILSSHLRLCLPSDLFPHIFPPKPCILISFPPYVSYASPISFFLI